MKKSSFIEDMTEFIFVENEPEQADIIFIPGGDQGAIAETAAGLYREGYAPLVLPSGRWSKPVGALAGFPAMRAGPSGSTCGIS